MPVIDLALHGLSATGDTNLLVFVCASELLVSCELLCGVLIEIYRIVSQKQIQDGAGGDAHTPSNNVQTITVAPTTSTGEQKKSCCN